MTLNYVHTKLKPMFSSRKKIIQFGR